MGLPSNEPQELSADPKVRELAKKREQDRILYEMSLRASRAQGAREGLERSLEKGRDEGLKKGRDEGLKKGRDEGARAMLQRLLAAKFGPLPEEAQARLTRATLQELEAWTDRVLTADTLEAVLDG